MFKKDIKYSLLLDFYGDILSERKREIIELYYNEDLSLSEVSEITGISRQGVRDSIKKSENELAELEEKLGLAERFNSANEELSEVISLLRSVKEKIDNDNINIAIEKLQKINF